MRESPEQDTLKKLIAFEVERAVQSNPRAREIHALPWVFEIGWAGCWPGFDSERLMELGRMRAAADAMTENRFRLRAVTEVFSDSADPSYSTPPLVEAIRKFLQQPGPLQDRIRQRYTLLADIPANIIGPLIDPESCARLLVSSFTENRTVLLDAIVKGLVLAAGSGAAQAETKRQPKEPLMAERRRTIFRKHLHSPAGLKNREKLKAAFEELDKNHIPPPDRTTAGKKRKPRQGSWCDLLKKPFSPQLLQTLRRAFYCRSTPAPKPAASRETAKK